jgi:hypothetical protein
MNPNQRDSIGLISPEVLTRAEALETQVPPAAFAEVLALVEAADEAGRSRLFAEYEEEWKLLLRHLPGLAPTLTLVHEHLDDPHCHPGLQDDGSHCPYLRKEGTAAT